MKTELVALKPAHVQQSIDRNLSEGRAQLTGVSVEELVCAYLSQGSTAYCLKIDGIPAAAGGIINLNWHRGEAWLLHSSQFDGHVKTVLKLMRQLLPEIAQRGNFRRVQATCFGVPTALLKHLGFEPEGIMQRFGPNGEPAMMLARMFGE